MKDKTRILEKLGGEVAAHLGTGLSEQRKETQERAVRALAMMPARSVRTRYLLAAATLVVAAAATFILLQILAPRPIVFWVGDHTSSGVSGAWLQASADRSFPIRFEDGTLLELGKGSSGRVFAADRNRVRIVLGNGDIRARIHKTPRSRFFIEAGPDIVTALGTDFSVFWSNGRVLLEVFVQEGVVEVKGPDLGKDAVRIAAGDHLRVERKNDIVSMYLGKNQAREPRRLLRAEEKPEPRKSPIRKPATLPSKPRSASWPLFPAKEDPSVEAEPGELVPETKVASISNLDSEDWLDLHDQGRYAAAVEAAERIGLVKLLSELDDAGLWKLADAARFVRRGEVATRALLAIRRRFPDSRRTEIATFLLGRIAAEQNTAPRKAALWFEKYLAEDPKGSLAEEALGRRIDNCRKAGMKRQAAKAAGKYLERYPQGPYAAVAESVLQEEGTR